MDERIEETSPRLKARIAGAFYLAVILLGVFAELFARGSIIISGDAAATARNIVAHEPLWRLGLAADLVAGACYAAVTVLLYELLKPVNKSLSLLAAVFSFAGVSVGAVSDLIQIAPLVLLGGAPYTAAFRPDQLQALAYMAVRLHGQGSLIDLVFFGLYCLLIGWLIFRSGFLPRIVGALMAIAGASYLINSFAAFLAPSLDLSPYILAPPLLGEGSLTLWLLAVGVNAERWRERAAC